MKFILITFNGLNLNLIKQLILFVIIFISLKVFAVRPFVTDDARIVSKGQIEIETYPNYNLINHEQSLSWHLMLGYSFTEWLEIIIGSGIGYKINDQQAGMDPVVLTPKILLLRSEIDSLMPGIALGLGTNIKSGSGVFYEDLIGQYAFFMATWRFYDDWINIHTNYGTRRTFTENETLIRPYWGIGLDLGIYHKDIRIIFEKFAGDPFTAIAPTETYQWGIRWLKSDYINYDITLGTQMEPISFNETSDHREFWIQIGIRLLFDTPYVANPSAEGAQGLFTR